MRRLIKYGLIAGAVGAIVYVIHVINRQDTTDVDFPDYMEEDIDIMGGSRPECCLDYPCQIQERFPEMYSETTHRLLRRFSKVTGVTCDEIASLDVANWDAGLVSMDILTASADYSVTYNTNIKRLRICKSNY